MKLRHVAAFGVELEGGWNDRPPARIKHDGSVNVSAAYIGEIASPILYLKEPQERRQASEYLAECQSCDRETLFRIRSIRDWLPPIQRAEPFYVWRCCECDWILENDNANDYGDVRRFYHSRTATGLVWPFNETSPLEVGWAPAERWIRTNHPQVADDSCGLHVHMSFDPHELCISTLLDSDEYQRVLDRNLRRWARGKYGVPDAFFDRLDGENTYCQPRWTPSGVYSDREDRYRFVNFFAVQAHGTIEIRILPMFRIPDLSVSSVKMILATTDRYITSRIKPEGDLTRKRVFFRTPPDEPHKEVIDVCV